MGKKVVLVITDGIGFCANTKHNAFYHASKPTYDKLFANNHHSLIETSGLSVGLPKGQMGNSEVGHMSIGSGRILYQDLVKISLALSEDRLKDNEELKTLLSKSNTIHLIGLMSDGGVHSHLEHFMGIANIASGEGKKVHLHLITDGRDVSPTSAQKYLSIVESSLDKNISIATISGRFYTMDRDNRWERLKRGYDVIVSATPKTKSSPLEYIRESYSLGVKDEFIEPISFEGYDGMQEGDGVLTINFRSDRMREIVSALGDNQFQNFSKKHIKLNLVTMTEYDKSFKYPVLFRKDTPKNTLAEVIAANNLRQLHTAETEKYAHVTFFFNGGVDEPYADETRVLIPSPTVTTYDEKPEMSANEVSDVVLKGIDDGYDFIVVNFANGDMVGHTGDFEAAKKAVMAVDTELGKIVQKTKDKGYALVITSDHGNCEEMCDKDGNILTNHTIGKVWCFVEADGISKVNTGGLNNIAPTILKLMDLDIPSEMDKALI